MRALAEIVQNQAGSDDKIPSRGYGRSSKMSKIRIEGFRASDREGDTRQHRHRFAGMRTKKGDAGNGV